MKWNPDTVLEFAALVVLCVSCIIGMALHEPEFKNMLLVLMGTFSIRYVRGGLRPRYNDPNLPTPPPSNGGAK